MRPGLVRSFDLLEDSLEFDRLYQSITAELVRRSRAGGCQWQARPRSAASSAPALLPEPANTDAAPCCLPACTCPAVLVLCC